MFGTDARGNLLDAMRPYIPRLPMREVDKASATAIAGAS